jgi:hypothetical protein
MKKLSIVEYRSSNIEQLKMVEFPNVTFIIDILNSKGLTKKPAGLCAGPWDKYFSIAYQSPRGVTHSSGTPLNVAHITVNEATGTYSKTKYFYSITIVKTLEFYYVTALAQSSRYNDTKGAEHISYECEENELSDVLDIIFKNVSK